MDVSDVQHPSAPSRLRRFPSKQTRARDCTMDSATNRSHQAWKPRPPTPLARTATRRTPPASASVIEPSALHACTLTSPADCRSHGTAALGAMGPCRLSPHGTAPKSSVLAARACNAGESADQSRAEYSPMTAAATTSNCYTVFESYTEIITIID